MILNYLTIATLMMDMYSSLAGRQLIVSSNERKLVVNPEHDQIVPAQHQLLDDLGEGEDPRKLPTDEYLTEEEHARSKRENMAPDPLTQRRPWTQKDSESFENQLLPLDLENRDYELDVSEAQNVTMCNYTVIPIPDPGNRIPRELEHVKCNHVRSRCQEEEPYYCIQTYRFIEVVYDGTRTEKMKVYSGCVCALLMYENETLEPYMPKLEIDN